jgi:hypothetical protein
MISMIITEDGESMGLDMGVDLDYKNPGQTVAIAFPSTDGFDEVVY